MISLESLTLFGFLLDKIEISLYFKEQGYNNWREKERNVCQRKQVGTSNKTSSPITHFK